jgi:hypothetical protein
MSELNPSELLWFEAEHHLVRLRELADQAIGDREVLENLLIDAMNFTLSEVEHHSLLPHWYREAEEFFAEVRRRGQP